MMRIFFIIILSLVVYFPAKHAWPHPASSVTATATANVVENITIISEQPLNFGYVQPAESNGTVTVSPDNRRSETGGVHISSPFSPATFAVRGMPGHNYTIHSPPSLTFYVTKQTRGYESADSLSELIVKDFVTYSTTAGKTTTSGKLDQTGQDWIYLGATLVVPANATPGIYSGWVPLTVSY